MSTELEAFIAQLKREGCSMVASIVKVASAYNIGMDAAKNAVHESTAWALEKSSHEEFQRLLGDALGENRAQAPTPDSPPSASRD